jgi:hypothetical protein
MTGEQSTDPGGDPSAAGLESEVCALYGEVDAAVAHLGPVCQISGRCCRFGEYGHTLFVSAPEFEYLLESAPEPARPLDEGETCPWQDRLGRCTARAARPLGCRVFFCDPAYQPHAPVLTEKFLARLKDLAARHGLPWNYAPLHRHLHDARADGRLEIVSAQNGAT